MTARTLTAPAEPDQRTAPEAVVPLQRWVSWSLICAGITVLGWAYAFVVPLGLPYDEPSHWGYVQYLAAHARLPVLGNPAVGYEAQMGPVAYAPQAVALRGWQLVGGSDAQALYVVRAANVIWLIALFVLVTRIVQAVRPSASVAAARIGAAVAVLNPMVVGMSMSVQNDTISLVLTLWLMLRVVRLEAQPDLRWSATSGALAAVAVLAKVSVGPAVAVLLVWPLVRWRRGSIVGLLMSGGTALLLSSWWFLRNLSLYGDLTGRAGVEASGYSFPPLGVSGQALVHLASSVVTYLWLPVEYYRNLVQTPGLVQAIVVAVTVLVAAAGLAALRDQALALPVAVAAISVTAWATVALAAQAVAFRTAYPVLALWAIFAAQAASPASAIPRLNTRFVGVLLLVTLLVLHAWVLAEVSSVSYAPGVQRGA